MSNFLPLTEEKAMKYGYDGETLNWIIIQLLAQFGGNNSFKLLRSSDVSDYRFKYDNHKYRILNPNYIYLSRRSGFLMDGITRYRGYIPVQEDEIVNVGNEVRGFYFNLLKDEKSNTFKLMAPNDKSFRRGLHLKYTSLGFATENNKLVGILKNYETSGFMNWTNNPFEVE